MVNNSTISGIKGDNLPYMNKATLSSVIGKKGESLNYWVKRLIKTGELISLKNGFFVGSTFLLKIRGQPALFESYREYLAGVIRFPSYLSLEYVLAKYDIIPDVPFAITAVTIKSTRSFTNDLGTFIYRNINRPLFTGYTESFFLEKRYFAATKVKALFDYLYLMNFPRSGIAKELAEGLRINWDVFAKTDLGELQKYVELSGQKKMEKIMNIIVKQGLI